MVIKIKRNLASFFFSTLLAFTAVFINTGCVTSPQPTHDLPPQEAVSVAPKPIASNVQEIVNKNCLAKCPVGTPISNILVDHDAIVLSSNRNTKFADWVAYLSKAEYIDGLARPRDWAQDPNIDGEDTFKPMDYKGMSADPYLFDRGHQAPLASFKNHPKWYVVNYLSNITPQKKFLNQGSWKDLESAERKLVKKYGQAYVITGPYYDKNDIIKGPPITRFSYTVPSGYWKIIAVNKGGNIQTVSFSFPQTLPKQANYCKQRIPLSNVQQSTGLTFFGGTPTSEDPELEKDVGCGGASK